MSDPKKPEEFSLSARLEALLFVATEPVPLAQLGSALDLTPAKVKTALDELGETLATRGLRIQSHRGRVQLTTVPELASLIQDFLNLDATTRLSPAALEALSIIARGQQRWGDALSSKQGIDSGRRSRRGTWASNFICDHARILTAFWFDFSLSYAELRSFGGCGGRYRY